MTPQLLPGATVEVKIATKWGREPSWIRATVISVQDHAISVLFEGGKKEVLPRHQDRYRVVDKVR
jgi:hypothetical protein